MKLWLREVCKQDGRPSPAWQHGTAWKRAARQILFSYLGLGGMRWTKDVLQQAPAQRWSCWGTCQQLWVTAVLGRCTNRSSLSTSCLLGCQISTQRYSQPASAAGISRSIAEEEEWSSKNRHYFPSRADRLVLSFVDNSTQGKEK